jgi:alpha-tubulin suppressor-like RCC1 family protein
MKHAVFAVCGVSVLFAALQGCGSSSSETPSSDLEIGQVEQRAITVSVPVVSDSGIFQELATQNGGKNLGLPVGMTNGGGERRSLLKFDLSSIPSNATVTGVTLTLTATKVHNTTPVAVYLLSKDWAEGAAVGPKSGVGGKGLAAATTDHVVTWSHAKYNTNPWATPGGDATGPSTASFNVAATGAVARSDSGLLADVRGWVTTPSSNFGWLLKSSTTAAQTAVLFSSREGTNPPQLSVTYTTPCDGVVCNSPGVCQISPGTCNPSTGACTYSTAGNGTGCFVGGDKCKPGTCQSGSCSAGTPVQCVKTCNDGTCNSSNGSCSFAPNPSLPCDDGNASTVDACTSSGTCVGTARAGNVYAWGDGSNGALGTGSTTTVGSPTPTSANLMFVAAGETHAVGVDPDGNLWAWGSNASGQLGFAPSSSPTTSPTRVTSYPGFFPTAVAAGKSHTLLISTVLGQVYAWGDNASGQLGDSTLSLSPHATPATVPGLGGAIAVAAGNAHSVVLKADGTVWTFGENSKGQLGNNDSTGKDQPAPIQAAMPVLAKAIAAGAEHTIALGVDGNVYAWGSNNLGAVAQAQSVANLWKPTKVSGLSMVKAIAAAGYHNVVVTTDGSAKTWGSNTFCELGNNTCGGAAFSPVNVIGAGDRFTQVSAGTNHCVGLTVLTNAVFSWGNNASGQLGYATPVNNSKHSTASSVHFGSNDLSVAAGGNRSFEVLNTRTLIGWGSNASGKLGVGSTQATFTSPTAIQLSHPVLSATAGQGNQCGAQTAVPSYRYLWGNDTYGQIGFPVVDSLTPRAPNDGTNSGSVDLQTGGYHTLRLAGDGTVWAMGYNADGELGDGNSPTNASSWVQVKLDASTALTNVVAISPGAIHSLALTADGSVYSWGNNSYLQLGRSGGNSVFAAKVTLPAAARAVTAGWFNSYALMGNGTVMAWGHNGSGELGDGAPSSTPSATPGIVQNVSLATQVAAGALFAIAISGGGIVGWGETGEGQLGVVSTTPIDPPQQTLGYPIARQIAAGTYSMYFLNIDGTVFGRGYDASGELGDGTTSSGNPNWVVPSNLRRVVSITAGGSIALAIQQP